MLTNSGEKTPRIDNPYVAGPPATGHAFFGRQDVFRFIEETLAAPKQNVIVLYGLRRSGKTSILLRLPDLLPPEDFHVVYFDLEGRARHRLSKVLYDLAHGMAESLAIPVPPPIGDKFNTDHFQTTFLPKVLDALGERRLVLLFDEFDVLADELWGEAAEDLAIFELLPYLRGLIAKEKQLVFVLVAGRRIEELPPLYQAIFKQAHFMRIFLLNRLDAIKLITEPVERVFYYDRAAIKAILDLTTAHPYFTQLICFELFNRVQRLRQKQVTREDVLAVVESIIERGETSFAWIWAGLPIPERLILSAIAYITEKREFATWEKINQVLDRDKVRRQEIELTDVLDRLLAWGIIRREEQDNYSIVVEIMRQWVVKRHPPQEARRDLEDASEIATQSYKKAERLRSEGNLQQAIEEYRVALRLNPNHLSARLSLAQALYQQGEFVQSIDEYEKAFHFDQDSARDGLIEARLALAESLEREKAFREAINHYQRVLKLSPGDQKVREKLDALAKKVKREKKVKRWPLLTLVTASVGVLVLALAAFFAAKGIPSKLETPTPTQMAAVVSPTATPSPTMTVAPEPSATNTPAVVPTTATPVVVVVTETPTATDTPVPPTAILTQTPTATDTPVPPTTIPTQTPTITPGSTQTPTSTPTPPLLPAPQLIWPEDGQKFIEHDIAIIELQWTWIRPLAEDEWFALGLRYLQQGNLVYTGEGKLKEMTWRVPSHLFGKADQPDRVYYWDVIVIKVTVNQDGSETITPVGLISETRTFYWP